MRSDVITCFCHAKSLRSFLEEGWDAYALQRQLATVDTMAPVVHADISFAKVGSFTWLVGLEDRTATRFVIHKRYLLTLDILREFL